MKEMEDLGDDGSSRETLCSGGSMAAGQLTVAVAVALGLSDYRSA